MRRLGTSCSPQVKKSNPLFVSQLRYDSVSRARPNPKLICLLRAATCLLFHCHTSATRQQPSSGGDAKMPPAALPLRRAGKLLPATCALFGQPAGRARGARRCQISVPVHGAPVSTSAMRAGAGGHLHVADAAPLQLCAQTSLLGSTRVVGTPTGGAAPRARVRRQRDQRGAHQQRQRADAGARRPLRRGQRPRGKHVAAKLHDQHLRRPRRASARHAALAFLVGHLKDTGCPRAYRLEL